MSKFKSNQYEPYNAVCLQPQAHGNFALTTKIAYNGPVTTRAFIGVDRGRTGLTFPNFMYLKYAIGDHYIIIMYIYYIVTMAKDIY